MSASSMLTVKAALAEVERLEAAAARWAGEVEAKTAELEAFEAASAARLVDDPESAGALTDEAARLRAGLALAVRARETAEQQLAEACRGVLLARAGELRAQARDLTAEADQREVKTGRLLAELQAWEQCAYEPRLDFGGGAGMGVRQLTRTQRLRMQAAQADKQAGELERFAAEQPAEQVAVRARQIAGQAAAAAGEARAA